MSSAALGDTFSYDEAAGPREHGAGAEIIKEYEGTH